MSWRIRHEGSPRALEGLTTAQVVEGLQDGLWETTDQVMGESDQSWVALESHPQFAEVAADIEPPPPRHYDDETRLDMNPLIDVCLVLLIFFILTTTYAALQRFLESPSGTMEDLKALPTITPEKLAETTVKVEVRMENKKPIIRVEGQEVDPENLTARLRQFQRESRKTDLFLDIGDDVPYGTEIMIRDRAKGAGFSGVKIPIGKPSAPSPS
jgi:biopolymer transport protein ExbD